MFSRKSFRLRMFLTLAIMVSLLVPVTTSVAQTTQASQSPLGTVPLQNKSTMELNQVLLMPYNDQQVLTLDVTVRNTSSDTISMLDYWLKVKLASGERLSVSQTGDSQSIAKIEPGTSKSISYYVKVNKNVKYSDISVQVIKWDFSANNFERIMGTFAIPKDYDPSRNNGFTYNNIPIGVTFTNPIKIELDDGNRVKITAQFTNNGTYSMTIPALQYYLKTPTGLSYVMASSNTGSITIQPRKTEKTTLTVDIPKEIADNKFTIYFSNPSEAEKIDLPIGVFAIDLSNATNNTGEYVNVGKEAVIHMGEDSYGITMKSIQRIPWEDDDILSATVKIRNLNKTAAAIPDLAGIFYLDNVQIDPKNTKKQQLGNLVALPINGTVDLNYSIEIPYHNNMENLILELLYSDNTDNKVDGSITLVSFKINNNQFSAIPVVAIDKSKKSLNNGKSTTQHVYGVNVYKSNNTKVYEVLLDIQNDEKRMTDLSLLTGYLKTSNQEYFPVSISEVKDKISPNGKALLSVYAKMPIGLSTQGLSLLLGDLNSDKSSYTNVAQFELPEVIEGGVVQSDFTQLKMYPYDIKIQNMKIGLSSDATLDFQYTIEKDYQYEALPSGHSIVVELVDNKSKGSYTKSFSLEQDLRLGTHNATMNLGMEISNPNIIIQQLDGFTMNVYDQFEGHNRLIGSRNIYAIYIQ